ncbi:MAG: DEAD/DEAH box helicase, partial [Calditrichaeota bacterium]|nr:DEAD/DEAH box helicase [Calditrichota bacterium]
FAENANGVHTLYISPLKALNNDIHVNLQEPLKGIKKAATEMGFANVDIRAAVRTGDTPPHLRQAMVKHPPHILITTPESLYLLLTSVRGRALFHNLRYLIVDEIHALSNNKRGVHLSLSMERLSALCQNEPLRIGLSATQRPLERIAAFLGGQTLSSPSGRVEPRPVKIVDCGQRKDMDLSVISPVRDFTDLPDATVWPKVIQKTYDLITAHKSTLVFVNMRAQAEKVARQLNEMHREATGDSDAFIALAHHGSISREVRYNIEARLKKGEIPAVIATASLELGIDIGSIDLVVQLESPKSVTAALQRVGRSGHLLRTTSKGRIIPLYQADLDDAAAITRCMFAGDIEETVVPENCLDVLAQQIVAEVAMRDWPRSSLYNLVRRSYCYRHLSEDAFNSVVEMLSGRFADAELRALRPRITWDKVNDRLIARRGSRLLAVMNGGTIADRGYYSIYLLDGKTRIGEIEEEFVFESRVGDVFFLGNNEWRINEITRDRILVSPLSSHKPRAPFWKGDPFFRDYSTSREVARFRREAVDHIENGDFNHWIEKTSHADQDTAANLLHYFQRQIENTGRIPTDKMFILEFFRDAADEPQLVLHAAVGGRITGAWAIALAAALEKRFNIQVQYSYNDDGLIIRLLDVVDPPPLENLFRLSADEMEQFLIDSLVSTPLFAVRFRHNATRSLLLQRSGLNKRIPLWLQRLRAADLMQAVSDQPDFPVLIETYRECLQDVFDVRSFREVIEKVRNGEIEIKMIETPHPSPFASGLIFRFLAENLYQEDRTRAPGYAAQVSSELLADILSREKIPTIVVSDIVDAAEAVWQHLAPDSRAGDAEDLYAIIAQLG